MRKDALLKYHRLFVKGGHPDPATLVVESRVLGVLVRAHILQCLINHICICETIICEEIELVQEIPDINATQRIHSGKW